MDAQLLNGMATSSTTSAGAPDKWGARASLMGGYLAEACAVGLLAPAGATVRFVLVSHISSLNLDRSAGYWAVITLFQQQAYLLPNLLGCCVMGMLVAEEKHQQTLHQAKAQMQSQPRRPSLLFLALTKGFCGSLTSFSAWAGAEFAAQQGAGLLFAELASFGVVFALTWAFFLLGFGMWRAGRIAFACLQRLSQGTRWEQFTSLPGEVELRELKSRMGESSTMSSPVHEPPLVTDVEDAPGHAPEGRERKGEAISALLVQQWTWILLFVTFLLIVWICVLVDIGAPFIPRELVRCGLRSAALAPAGALCRWGIAKGMGPRLPPRLQHLSTLLSNCLGVALFMALTHAQDWSWSKPISSGFAGSLTTVSTLVVELKALYEGGGGELGEVQAARYLMTTTLLALLLCQLIVWA